MIPLNGETANDTIYEEVPELSYLLYSSVLHTLVQGWQMRRLNFNAPSTEKVSTFK